MTRPKAVPQPTPETQPFWDAAQVDELRVQRCLDCDEYYFYPRPFCPTCLGDNVSWERVSGRATLLSYVINHRPAPGFEDEAPYAIAVVELEEGPRLLTNIVGIENTPEHLVLDMPLEVTFEDQGGTKVPKFKPAAPA
jgi:uncharacterized OB-fold protein